MVPHIEMPLAQYNQAMLDALSLCGSLASCFTIPQRIESWSTYYLLIMEANKKGLTEFSYYLMLCNTIQNMTATHYKGYTMCT